VNSSDTRTFTPARIVALAILAVLIAGLALLSLAPRPGRLAVPLGAEAGELTDLEPCTVSTEDGSYRADCATLVVPENRRDPRSRLIALPVTRIRSTSSLPGEPLFHLEGGPGRSNMAFAEASRFVADRDVVLVGYRGVDGSSVLDCPEVESAVRRTQDRLSEKAFGAYGDALQSCAARLTAEGADLAGYSLAQRVDDLEAARTALGFGRIDLLSQSAGTRTAMIYAWRYPNSIHRSVMVGVNPPGHYFWDPATTDRILARYSELCARAADCRERTDDLAATLRETAADMDDRWGLLPIKADNVRIAAFISFFETAAEASPVSGPMAVDAWLSAAEGDPSGLWLESILGDFTYPTMFTWGEMAATGSQDADVAEAYYAAGGDQGSILGNPMTDFLWGGGRLADWPGSPDDTEYRQVRTSAVDTLLIGGELDLSTPPEVATEELLPYLPNGQQVVVPGIGHTTSFWNDQPEAGSRLINTYLESGQVDRSLYKPGTVDFTPPQQQTTLAKIVALTLIGGALLTIVSLVWMARRVHKRGHFGPKAGAILRAGYTVILGLGGWFLGVLVALVTMPGLSLDSEILAAISIGAPVGLGTYLAWVNREWFPSTRAVGFGAAMASALVGGWLGFHAVEGLIAVSTTIVGAIVGANGILLGLDIAWDSQGRDRSPAPTIEPGGVSWPRVGVGATTS